MMVAFVEYVKSIFYKDDDGENETFSPEIESAARWMCEQKGLDPDEMGKFFIDHEVRWHRYARELECEINTERHRELKSQAISMLRGKP